MVMAIIGICGRMGSQIYENFKESYNIIGIDRLKHPHVKCYTDIKDVTEKIDIAVDFSAIDCFNLLKDVISLKIPLMSGTTGYSEEQLKELEELAANVGSKFIWRANYAKGISLFSRIIKECQKDFSIMDFVEIHATTKKDAPSGTAKVLAKELNIPYEKIQSVRINMAPAIHEIIFSSADERVIIRHEIINKHAFIIGFEEELKAILGDLDNVKNTL